MFSIAIVICKRIKHYCFRSTVIGLDWTMSEIILSDVLEAIELVRGKQQLYQKISQIQINVVCALVKNNNSLNQLPTGSGKTWPVVCFPLILDTLRDIFHYPLPQETRVLYVVPLVNLYHSLSIEMENLKIPYQVLRSFWTSSGSYEENDETDSDSSSEFSDEVVSNDEYFDDESD